MPKLHLIELAPVNTSIDWWNQNRKRINKVIQKFNDWQTEDRLDVYEKDVLLAMIEACKKYGYNHDFSDWQYETLNEMKEWVDKLSGKEDGE